MNIKLYFFCDYEKLPDVKIFYDFFTRPDIKIITNEDVTFRFTDSEIENRADFILSKIDEVPNLVNLGAQYKNIKFHVEFELVLSEFHIRQILKIAEGLNNIYPLYYYSEEIATKIEPFDLEDILAKIITYRDEYVLTDDLGSVNNQFYINTDKLNYILDYQEGRQFVIDKIKEENKIRINVNPFIALKKIKHNEHHEINFAMDLNLDYITIIPEQIDYFYVPDSDGDGNYLVKADVILKDFNDYFTIFEDFVSGTRITDFEQTNKIKKKFTRKLKKYRRLSSDKADFEVVGLFGLLDDKNRE